MSGTVPLRPKGRPTQSQAEQVPERLLDAATWLFVHHGYGDTSMEAIARRAGASTKTVYSRFANKQDVLRAVVKRLFERTVPPFASDGTIRDEGPAEGLNRLGRMLADLSSAEETAGINRLIFAEAFRLPELAALFLELHGQASRHVQGLVGSYVAAGRLDAVPDLETRAALFVEMTASMPRLTAILGRPMDGNETARTVNAAVRLFLNGCAARVD